MASWGLTKSEVTLFPNTVTLGSYWGSPFTEWETPLRVCPDPASPVAPLAALRTTRTAPVPAPRQS